GPDRRHEAPRQLVAELLQLLRRACALSHAHAGLLRQQQGQQLAEARRLAKRDVARAEGESRSRQLLGRGEAARIAQTGVAEAAVALKKIRAYGDPRLFALNLLGGQLAASRQPLVPQRLLMMGGGKDGGAEVGSMSLLGNLIALLLAEKAGVDLGAAPAEMAELNQYVEDLVAKAGQDAPPVGDAPDAADAADNDASAEQGDGEGGNGT
ncbi:MAG TPA: hypothetical protein VFJ30_11260, partial [Phycisphaerae bacterium]|nr:hypothetical protein [Phycisphaerae bacterium]